MLHVSPYMPLHSCGGVGVWVVGFVSCRRELVVLNAIFMSVFLNRFVIFLTWGVLYVKVVHFLSFFFCGVVGCEKRWSVLSFNLCNCICKRNSSCS